MERTCLKCGHVNAQATGKEMEACPACGAIYSKVERALEQRQQALATRQAADVAAEAGRAKKSASPSITARYNNLEERMRKRTGLGMGAWLLVLLVVVPIAWLFLTQERTPQAPAEAPSPFMVFVICQGFVKSGLKAPASAQFPSKPLSAIDTGNNTYLVTSTVDAQNSFGAMLRSDWLCKAQYTGGPAGAPGSWKLLEMKIS